MESIYTTEMEYHNRKINIQEKEKIFAEKEILITNFVSELEMIDKGIFNF